MANSTTNLDTIQVNQAGKEVTANALFDALSGPSLFGRRASATALLTWGYYGGNLLTDNGAITQVSNGNVSLTANATNYVEAARNGAVVVNTTGFTAGRMPMYTVVANATAASSYTDYRAPLTLPGTVPQLAKVLSSDANVTLSADEARCGIITLTNNATVTANRNVYVPLGAMQWTVDNSCNVALNVVGATGNGVNIGANKVAIVYADGTNVKRVTADT